jgi:tetratricopeptide (TPR) repeat protein
MGGLMACQSNKPPQKENVSGVSDSVSNSSGQPVDAQGQDSLAALQRRIGKDSTDLKALLERARINKKLGKLEKAKLDLYQAQRLDSSRARTLKLLGEVMLEANRSREARNYWRQCAAQNPDYLPCRVRLARLFYTVGDFEKALKWVNEALDLDKYHAEVYFLKGLIVRDKTGDTNRALPYVQRATELKTDYLEALDAMGVMLSAQGDTLAPYYYQRILDIEPQRADIHYKLGVYYMNQDQPNRAIEAYTKATELNPTYADPYYNLGYMFIQMKDYATARDYFTKAIKAEPKKHKSYYGRAYAYEMLGDVINARQDYQKVLELVPQHRPARKGLKRVQEAKVGP